MGFICSEIPDLKEKCNKFWEDLVDNLHTLAERAFLEVNEDAKDKLSLYHFLHIMDKPDVALAVCQKHPRKLDDAVATTLEIETFLSLGPHSYMVTNVLEMDEEPSGSVNVIQVRKYDAVAKLLQTVIN